MSKLVTSDWWDVEDDEIAMPPTFPLKVAPPDYVVALERCWLATGYPYRKQCLIAIDGFDGAGKSSFAAWLAWQLGAPCLFLDGFRVRRTPPLSWRLDEIERLLSARLDHGRPVVVESVFLLDALSQLGRKPDLLIYVESEDRRAADAMEGLVAYVAREGLLERADVVVRWSGEGPVTDRPWTTART
ncbi:hypothetical protein FV242_01785 [Methylobacterium sp. WL64]|uniref:hypothetical protein n=1 Tax=Methylobacterium sp. WL64 TaxID=2603894 RepID=UPI0011C879D3|nr:hypothetical protein [Methylobacterium sp. WL64]TXN05927.1 hypothetical protein FV242_01785 [Methylobacterium sp. WL64]